MDKKLIAKLEKSGKLEFTAVIKFNFRDDILDSYTAEQKLYDLMGDVYRTNLNLFESIDMEIK